MHAIVSEYAHPLPVTLRQLRWAALAHIPDRHGWGVAWEEITDALRHVPAARSLSPEGLAALATQRLDRALEVYDHPAVP